MYRQKNFCCEQVLKSQVQVPSTSTTALQHSDVTRLQTSTDLTATKLFSRNHEGMFQQDGSRAHTYIKGYNRLAGRKY